MPSQIRVGSGVTAAVGPYTENTNDTSMSENTQRKSYRKRTWYSGIVVGSVSEQKWRVYWEETGQISVHSTTKLKYVGPRTIPSHIEQLLLSMPETNVENQDTQFSQSQSYFSQGTIPSQLNNTLAESCPVPHNEN